MKSSRVGKASICLALGICGLYCVSLLGQPSFTKDDKTLPQPVDEVLRGSAVSRVRGQERQFADLQQVALASRGEVGAYSMLPLIVQIEQGSARVSAQANFKNLRPDTSFVWAIKVYSKKNGVMLINRVYDRQQFSLISQDHQLIDFAYVVKLGPGEYKAQVVLYQLMPGAPLAKLKDEATESDYRICQSSRAFTIVASQSKKSRNR